MKAVLISIRPKWAELIASGEKTVEVRKSRPKLETPFKCYIYQSGKNLTSTVYGAEFSKSGYVIGEFVCDRIFQIDVEENGPFSEERGGGYREDYSCQGFHDCLTDDEFDRYLNGGNGYGWHISALKIYDKPKELGEFNLTWGTVQKRIKGKTWVPMELMESKVTRPPMSWFYVVEEL